MKQLIFCIFISVCCTCMAQTATKNLKYAQHYNKETNELTFAYENISDYVIYIIAVPYHLVDYLDNLATLEFFNDNNKKIWESDHVCHDVTESGRRHTFINPKETVTYSFNVKDSYPSPTESVIRDTKRIKIKVHIRYGYKNGELDTTWDDIENEFDNIGNPDIMKVVDPKLKCTQQYDKKTKELTFIYENKSDSTLVFSYVPHHMLPRYSENYARLEFFDDKNKKIGRGSHTVKDKRYMGLTIKPKATVSVSFNLRDTFADSAEYVDKNAKKVKMKLTLKYEYLPTKKGEELAMFWEEIEKEFEY